MRYLLAPIAIVVTTALLFASVAPASACSCIPIAPASEIEYYATNATVIGIGSIGELFVRSSDTDTPFDDLSAIVVAERYLKGSGPAVIEVDDPIHDGFCAFFKESMIERRLVLFMSEREGRPFTSLCSGNFGLGQSPDQDQMNARLAELENITGPGQPPTDVDDGDDLPRDAFWALAIVLPLAFLAAATLVGSRRR